MESGIYKMQSPLLRIQRSRQRLTLVSNLLAIFLFFIVVSHTFTLAHAQCSNTVGCFSSIANLAIGRTIQTNSQCAENDTFCLHGTTDCSNDCRPSLHSIASINDDNTGTAWISNIGIDSINVTLQLDFQEPVLFDNMKMIWKSSRPRSMELERSVDSGATWEAYRYYSTSCTSDFQNVPGPVNTIPSVQFTSTMAVCTASQSALLPHTNGEVHTYTLVAE